MKKPLYFLLIVFFIIAGIFLYSSLESKNTFQQTTTNEQKVITPSNINYVLVGGQKVKVDLAITNLEKQKGLSVKESLGQNEGMLFVFDQPSRYAFWMKDMKFSIDILWLNKDGKIVYIAPNATPQSYPNTFIPTEDASYVLESMSGFSIKNNLKVGDQTSFK